MNRLKQPSTWIGLSVLFSGLVQLMTNPAADMAQLGNQMAYGFGLIAVNA